MSQLLAHLEPKFYRRLDDRRLEEVKTMAEAQGLDLLCPKCFEKNAGPVGTHHIIVWFADRGVPAGEAPGPGRWVVSGTGLTDITLSPSILLSNETGCGWHGYIRSGMVLTC